MPRANLKASQQRFEKNILKRGNVNQEKPDDNFKLNPYVLGILLFVVVGSAVLQIIRTASSA